MVMNRRAFLKLASVGAAATGVGALGARTALAARPAMVGAAETALLIDTTRCQGCRACEAACAEANGLQEPALAGQPGAFDRPRRTEPGTLTVVNRRAMGGKDIFVKQQCMHCVEPACVAACLAKALVKTPSGAVIYNEKVCIGCRYCMVSCPFEIPRFEYDKAVPAIRKCQFCFSRQARGQPIACASVCPTGALAVGTRQQLLEEARGRIYRSPGRYVHHVYGEHEAGGTNVLYLSNVPFETLGFRTDLGERSYARLASTALAAVPFVLVIGAPLLLGLHAVTRQRAAEELPAADGQAGTEDHDG